jgi:hypothetical protein
MQVNIQLIDLEIASDLEGCRLDIYRKRGRRIDILKTLGCMLDICRYIIYLGMHMRSIAFLKFLLILLFNLCLLFFTFAST